MSPEDPRHGSYCGAQQHLRDDEEMCAPCHRAFRSYQRRHSKDRLLGRPRNVPAAPVRAHLQTLKDSGMTVAAIVARSGVSRATIQDVLTRPRDKIRRDNADALLAVAPVPVSTGRTPSVGIIRRLQALGRLGWSSTAIEAEARRINPAWPITANGIRQLLSCQYHVVTVPTADAIRAVYDSLSMRLPEPGRQTSQVRNRAARKGWLPPLAWDAIDDPNERPERDPYRPVKQRNAAEMTAELDHLLGLGVSIHQAAKQLGVSIQAIEKATERAKGSAA